MTLHNGKIILCTEDELRTKWLSEGMDDVFSFPEYIEYKAQHGWKIVEVKEE
jgi:hypothetical protein